MRRLDQVARGMQATGLGALLRRLGTWRGTLILNYHRLGDAGEAAGDRFLFNTTPEGFAGHLALLQRAVDVVSLDEVLQGAGRTSGRRVLITFDDGYRDNAVHALPALRAAGLPAAFFIATGFIDAPSTAWWDEIAWILRKAIAPRDAEPAIAAQLARSKAVPADEIDALLDELAERTGSGRRPPAAAAGDWMTWDMVRELRDAGMAIGAHSVTHPVLARASHARQEQEISTSVTRLEAELGGQVRTLSYPVGTPDAYDATTKELVRGAGLEAAFALSGGAVPTTGWSDRFAIPRTSVSTRVTPDRFAALLTLPQVYGRW